MNVRVDLRRDLVDVILRELTLGCNLVQHLKRLFRRAFCHGREKVRVSENSFQGTVEPVLTHSLNIVAGHGLGMSHPEKPPTPNLPDYLADPIERQDPERLETIAQWASELAEYKRTVAEIEAEQRRDEQGINDEQREELEERDDVSTNPDNYDDVPGGAYIVTKTIDGNDYYYWQWRSNPSKDAPDKSKYIAPVNPKG